MLLDFICKKNFFIFSYLLLSIFNFSALKAEDMLEEFVPTIISDKVNQVFSDTEGLKVSDKNEGDDDEVIQRRFIGLLTYVKGSEAWRKSSFDLSSKIKKDIIERGGEIPADDLKLMHKDVIYYFMHIRRPIIDLIAQNDYQFKYMQRFPFDTYDLFKLDLNGRTRIVQPTPINNKRYYINPNDKLGRRIIGEFYFTLAANIVLMDNYTIGLYPYLKDKKLRRSIFVDLDETLVVKREVVKSLWTNMERRYKNSAPLVSAIKFYEKSLPYMFASKNDDKEDVAEFDKPLLQSLRNIIENSHLYKNHENGGQFANYIKNLNNRIAYDMDFQRDWRSKGSNDLTHRLSKAFGNAAGNNVFQTREGKLKHLPRDVKEEIVRDMKPLDILLEKTPFRLTDKFIPGHYGHVAIWAGNKQELIDLGVWHELPLLHAEAKMKYGYRGQDFQESILEGHHIIEALRPGVQINTLEHFLDIDDMAVLRTKVCEGEGVPQVNCLTKTEMRESLISAFQQLGKDYDFNFDANTQDKIVCSELAFRTFTHMDWETSKTFGKYAISPDQIAVKADDMDDPFYPHMIYFNGVKVEPDESNLHDVFGLLLSTNYTAVEKLTGICQYYDYKKCR